mgnify:CR=1 FL=1
MAIEIKAPTFPESVADGTVATWHKQPGDAVKRDELLVDIETDKVVMEVLAEADGVMGDIAKAEGDTVLSGEVPGVLKDGEAASAPAADWPLGSVLSWSALVPVLLALSRWLALGWRHWSVAGWLK